MRIEKLKLTNFKKFRDETLEFNDDLNILVGDNETGKSSVLEAIEIGLNLNYRGKPLASELTTDLFNNDCIKEYLEGDKSQSSLPEIHIEVFLNGDPELRGDRSSEDEAEGVYVKIVFDEDLSDPYAEFISDIKSVTTLPVEFYKILWFSFADKRMSYHHNKMKCLFVDPSRIHPTYGRAKYINGIINAALEKSARTALNLNYRQLKVKFNKDEAVVSINKKLDSKNEVTEKSLKITADIGSTTSWESGLQLTVDDVVFNQIGKGEQNQIQIKLALQNRGKNIEIVMIEEPENHLSHMNLVRLVKYIEEKNNGKQIFITTHSSYVLNKLNFNKVCLLGNGYARLGQIESATVKTLRRFPGYDSLRVVLAKRLILVEGPSDELVVKKMYIAANGVLPEQDGIDILVVRGIGFRNYLNIAKAVGVSVRVVKDNDGDFEKNITEWAKEYAKEGLIDCTFSPEDNKQYSLEPSLIASNGKTEKSLDKFAGVILSKQTYKEYAQSGGLDKKKNFLREWFGGENTGSKKVDSAIRLFDSLDEIEYPEHLKRVIKFGQ